ncbi:hypothetical protein HH682_12655 [Rosenbergiella sp. S61]|uniref:Uncharacterized protein n=1 Tax=Rosenbergiella gaditana TaxID=2726987 RepID=A0ABS5SYS0_9GAMM|nr:hypothetical protein [Rosenbergiella gaditana]MBT0725251.1 hypothetical protein [Rosenbergiella gaditana]
MINTVLAGFEKLCRYKDFYFGMKPEALQFYQLGEGYLAIFSHLYRQTGKGHYLHRSLSDPLIHSPIRGCAQRLEKNARSGQEALERKELTAVLAAIGQQIMLATATIASCEEGLYLAATLYNKAQSFDTYRTFVDKDLELSARLHEWFDEAVTLATLLIACDKHVTSQGFVGQKFSDYQRYRLVLNRLYVMINQGFYLLDNAAVEITAFLTTLHQSHLSQRWMMTHQEKLSFFEQHQRDITQYIFIEANEGGDYCYHLESGQLVPSPDAIQPNIGEAELAFARQLHADSSAQYLRDSVRKRMPLKGGKEPIAVMES